MFQKLNLIIVSPVTNGDSYSHKPHPPSKCKLKPKIISNPIFLFNSDKIDE